jgi:hypothetical protein
MNKSEALYLSVIQSLFCIYARSCQSYNLTVPEEAVTKNDLTLASAYGLSQSLVWI